MIFIEYYFFLFLIFKFLALWLLLFVNFTYFSNSFFNDIFIIILLFLLAGY